MLVARREYDDIGRSAMLQALSHEVTGVRNVDAKPAAHALVAHIGRSSRCV